jgi:transposase
MELSAGDRVLLQGIVGDRNSRAKHVYRARIVLLAGDGLGSTRVAHAVGKSEPTVRRWLERFAAQGVDGLLRDATRPPGRPPLAKSLVERVVHLTLHEPPPDATQWSARRLARVVGIGHGAIQKIWAAHGLKPHLVRLQALDRSTLRRAAARRRRAVHRSARARSGSLGRREVADAGARPDAARPADEARQGRDHDA